MGFISDAKDRMIEAMALPVLNRTLFAPYGQARELRLDSTAKTAELLLDLKGEEQPLRIAIDGYEFSRIGEDTFLTLRAIRTSREWMTAAALHNVAGRPVKLPSEFAGILSRLV